jgi:hypothetical protein
VIGYYVVLAMVVVACAAVLIYLFGPHEAGTLNEFQEKERDE